MKKLFNLNLLLLVLSVFILSACGDDDDKVKTTGEFTLSDETTKISSGIFVYDTSPNTDDDGDGYHRNQLIFLGTGLKITGSGNEAEIVGEGNMLELYINNEAEALQTGTYTWQAEGNEQPFDLWGGYLTTDVNTGNEVSYRLEAGTVVVTKSGSAFKITFTGAAYIDEDDEGDRQKFGLPPFIVTAEFSGKLKQMAFDF